MSILISRKTVHNNLVVATTLHLEQRYFFFVNVCVFGFFFQELIFGILLKLTSFLNFQVNIQYPSKTVHKVIHDEWRAKGLRKASRKNAKTSVDRSNHPSLLRATSPDSLLKLTDIHLNEEVRTRAPTLHRFLLGAALNERSQRKVQERTNKGEKSVNTDIDRPIPAVSMATSLLLRARCLEMSANMLTVYQIYCGMQVVRSRYSRVCNLPVFCLFATIFLQFEYNENEHIFQRGG